MKELIEKFEKETGLEFYTTSLDKGEDLYSYDFVNWLIKQLPIHGVSNRRELLIAFFLHFRNNGEQNIGMTIEQFVDDFLSN